MNGYSGQGDVTAEVVYVNYGLIEDYAQLDSMGVSVKGKIAIARYGRSFRGIKAREAEKHGAVGLLIYSDPQDDGYVVGDVYPDGPMRNSAGVQRGSVLNLDGDPSTPGYGSTGNVARLTPDHMEIPHIPVVPIGYGNAGELLKYVRGAAAPRGWQGGLPFHYHVGAGPVRARITVADDRATKPLKPIYDTFGIVRGSEFPDELVIIGGHRDGWGPGAADNVSGTVSILEAARAVAEELKAGVRPKRTIIFATWDAEEWGLIGSTEFVEEDSLRLSRDAVAYLNQDVAAQGPRFGGGGSPSLARNPSRRGAVGRRSERPRAVSTPNGAARAQSRTRRSPRWAIRAAAPTSPASTIIWESPSPSGDSVAQGGVYHSQYDDYAWMTKFGDPGFQYHAAAARVGTAMLLRVANADILPYDYVGVRANVRRYIPPIEQRGVRAPVECADATLRAAIDRFEREAAASTRRATPLSRARCATPTLQRANRALMQVERALIRPQGLRTASVVPQPDLRRGREQRLREHGAAVDQRGDSRQ